MGSWMGGTPVSLYSVGTSFIHRSDPSLFQDVFTLTSRPINCQVFGGFPPHLPPFNRAWIPDYRDPLVCKRVQTSFPAAAPSLNRPVSRKREWASHRSLVIRALHAPIPSSVIIVALASLPRYGLFSPEHQCNHELCGGPPPGCRLGMVRDAAIADVSLPLQRWSSHRDWECPDLPEVYRPPFYLLQESVNLLSAPLSATHWPFRPGNSLHGMLRPLGMTANSDRMSRNAGEICSDALFARFSDRTHISPLRTPHMTRVGPIRVWMRLA
jgi:hypothetical protein